ncbi:hypothetical protein ACFWSF_28975 [Streptomyces sp. NPDC058611]|uniref:hypothetical protein n=1 Tax=unclassified Streptomyces TaxID=2593676 RepID=UPI00365F41A0
MTTRARSFDAAAALYHSHRPGYPGALFDAVLLGRPRTRAFLDEERARLFALFPDGSVEERYVVSLSVAVP